MRRLTRLPLAVLLALTGAELACEAVSARPEAAPAARKPEGELATTPVEVRRPKGELRIAGELRAFQEVSLRARLPAYVRQRLVDVGDRVKRGDVLVVLSAPERVAERAEAEAELSVAEARLRRLEAASARAGAVAPLELEGAKASVASLGARVQALRELERELTMRAPFSGVVTGRGADEGSLVGAGGDTALVSLAELSRLRLAVAVPERYARAALRGAQIPFRLEGDDPATKRAAVVSRVRGVLDSATRTLDVELDVDNGDGRILAGSFADVLWPLDNGAEHPWVPATAIAQCGAEPCVWIKRGDRLAKVTVGEVLREGQLVAVRAPLSRGDLVVSRASEDLVEGLWPSSPGSSAPRPPE